MSRNHLVRGLAALLLTGAVHQAGAAVFGLDRRKPFDATTAFDLGLPLSAVGTITCLDRHEGTGFVVDVSGYVVDEVDFHVVATAARSLTNPESGKSRGRCAFRPASDPGVHLEIGDLGERLVGTDAPENADGGDWAFAKLDKGKYELGSLRIAFEDVYDFDTPGEVEVRAIGLDDEEGVIAVSSSCRLDDKRAYPTLRRRDDGLDQMILHDCDFLGPAKGGPLVVFEGGEAQVVAINTGDSGGQKFPRLSAVPYDPKRSFYNFSRRFDLELEQKLVAFVSRFAHLKNPSQTIKAQSELIRNVQSNLTRLGYDTGPVDGFMGIKTRDAIRAFQTSLGITPTGRVSEELLLLLESK